MIAKSGGRNGKAGDGLFWKEGAVFGPKRQGQFREKPIGAPQVVQSGIRQGDEDFAQPWAAQRVPVLIPAAVFHMMLAVLDAPVVAKLPQQSPRPAPLRRSAGQEVPPLLVTSPVSNLTLSLSTSPACRARGTPVPPGHNGQSPHRSTAGAAGSPPPSSAGLQPGLPQCSRVRPGCQSPQHRRLLPLHPHHVVPAAAGNGLA